jgi:hypothetical protein
MHDPYSHITAQGIYAFRSDVPEDQVALAKKADGWVPKAVTWLIVAMFAAVLLPTFLYISYAANSTSAILGLWVLSGLVTFLVGWLVYHTFAYALFVRTLLLWQGRAIFVHAASEYGGNMLEMLYLEQAARLQYVPDSQRRADLRDLLIKNIVLMRRGLILTTHMTQEGMGPGDDKYDAASRKLEALEEEIAATIDAYVEGEPS